MYSKIIFVLALFCVVNASVITVNVFDDDPESEGELTREGCTFLSCDRYCRGRYGYVGAGGRCIKGRCKCDYFRNTKDEVSETVESLSIHKESETQRDCNFRACDQLCRRLGFTGGACVDGRCKCDNFYNTKESQSTRSCDYQMCNQRCQKLGFTGGVCVNGRCKCNHFRSSEDATNETGESLSQRDCNFRACDQQCRRLGFTGGACVNGRCKCDNFRNTEDVVSELAETLSKSAESLSQRNCNFRACDQQCRRLGFTGGACVNGRCKCDNFRNTEDVVSELAETLSKSAESLSQRNCNFRACDQQCRRLGFTGGACVNGRCKCDNFRNTEDVVSELAETLSKSAESLSQRNCNFRACDQQCRRLGFTGGACVNGRCKCDNFRNTEDVVSELAETLSKSAESLSQRNCNFRACDQQCRRLGFTGGACVNGRCKCDNFRNIEDVVSELAETLSKSAESLSQCNCNFRAYDQQCRRLGFTGGACVNGRCKCDNFSNTEETSPDMDTTSFDDEETNLILMTDKDE